jgi:hypothetical protein
MNGAAFQQHERSGRGTKRLRGNGHRISFAGMVQRGSGAKWSKWGTQTSWHWLQRTNPRGKTKE